MKSNKDRLYIGLHARAGASKMPGGEDKYHWALLLGPKQEHETSKGKRFHAKETVSADGPAWHFAEDDVVLSSVMMLLVRIQIAKVKDSELLASLLGNVPIRAGQVPGWNCVGWVKEALEAMEANGAVLGSSSIEWQTVRDVSMGYAKEKIEQHRFDGTAASGQFDMAKVPTFDLLKQKEAIP